MQPNTTPPDALAIFVGALISGLGHVGMVALAFLWAAGQPEPDLEEDPLLMEYTAADLLAWGEVMPEDGQLPWIANPAPAPEDALPPDPNEPIPEETSLPDQETVNINQESSDDGDRVEELQPEQEEQPEEAPPARDRGENNPHRPTNNDPVMGSPDGFVGGTSLSESAIRNQFSQIQAQLNRSISRPSAISASEFRRLSAELRIRVTAAGRISSWSFISRSGNDLFDAAVESGLNRFHMGRDRLRINSVTNDDLRQSMIDNGFRITVRGE